MFKHHGQKHLTRRTVSPVRSCRVRVGVLSVGLAVVLLSPAIRADVAPAPEIRELVQEDQDVKIRVAVFSGPSEDVTIGPIVRTGDDEQETVIEKTTVSAAEIQAGEPTCRPAFYYDEEVDCDGDGEAECPGYCVARIYDFWDTCVPPGAAEYRLTQSPPWGTWDPSVQSIEVTDSQVPCDADEDTDSIADADTDSIADADTDSIADADTDSIADADSESIADADSESIADADSESIADDDSDMQRDSASIENNDAENNDADVQDGSEALLGADAGNGCSAVPTSAAPNLFKLILQLL